MKMLLTAGVAAMMIGTAVSAQTLPDQSVPSAQNASPSSTAPIGGTPGRAGPRVKKKSGFFGLPLLGLVVLGGVVGAAAASGGGSSNNGASPS